MAPRRRPGGRRRACGIASVTGPEMADVARPRGRRRAGARLHARRHGTASAVLVWFHGGGWVIGSVADSDVTARELADGAGVVGRRRSTTGSAPEHRFPAAVDDCRRRHPVGARPRRRARRRPRRASPSAATRPAATWPPSSTPASCVAGWPSSCSSTRRPTPIDVPRRRCAENGEGYLLTTASMEWFSGHYLDGTGAGADRRAPLAARPRSTGAVCRRPWSSPPSSIPLRDEGEAYAAKLARRRRATSPRAGTTA